ncbi:hypothetical protein [Bibersteinia trehalosi]|uniref:hypothetical protein n=1 Tax=Bibersteinia trehalosi TaxID=47735 RepID=UPI00404640D9
MAKKLFNQVADTASNVIDKVSSPAFRAGHTVERVGKMLEAGVSPRTIATQMSDNSTNEIAYTEQDILAFGNLYQDAKTKVVVTSEQARALIADQLENNDVISEEIQLA